MEPKLKTPKTPKTPKKAAVTLADAVPPSKGAGMTAGLEICRLGDKFILIDHSADARFADDVATWNDAATVSFGLNPTTTKKTKDAAK